MLSIINCITEPYLLQSYIFTYNLNTFFLYAHVFTDWKVIVPVPDYSSVRHLAGLLAYGSSSGRLPAFAVTFLSFVPVFTVEAAAGDFHPTSLTVFHFSVPDRLFSRCCKFSVEPLKGYHFLSDFATPFYYTAMFVFLYTFLLSFLSLQKKE